MTPAPALRAVPQSTESAMRLLFQREDDLLAELATVRAEQVRVRNVYAEENGLMVRPSVQGLRKVLGA